jgi:hypothetical protein
MDNKIGIYDKDFKTNNLMIHQRKRFAELLFILSKTSKTKIVLPTLNPNITINTLGSGIAITQTNYKVNSKNLQNLSNLLYYIGNNKRNDEMVSFNYIYSEHNKIYDLNNKEIEITEINDKTNHINKNVKIYIYDELEKRPVLKKVLYSPASEKNIHVFGANNGNWLIINNGKLNPSGLGRG